MDVKKPGIYRIVAMYSNVAQTIQFLLNSNPPKQFSIESYPDWVVWHIQNKADCGEISFPQTGLQLLGSHYKSGNNLAYFDFVPAS
jgi:hypothetical protein